MTAAQRFVKEHSDNNNFIIHLLYDSMNFWDSDLFDSICETLKLHFPDLENYEEMASLIAKDIRQNIIQLTCTQAAVSFIS
jgi:hypothetical protein